MRCIYMSTQIGIPLRVGLDKKKTLSHSTTTKKKRILFVSCRDFNKHNLFDRKTDVDGE